MNDNHDFEIIENTRDNVNKPLPASGGEHLAHAMADNFGRIMDVACALAEVQRIGAQADAYVKARQADRETLAQETENYVKKLQAETDAKISKVEVIRRLMQDYYASGQTRLSGEEFSRIISKIIDDGGIFDNGTTG